MWSMVGIGWVLTGLVVFLRLRRRVLHGLGFTRRGTAPLLAIGPGYLLGGGVVATSVVVAWPVALGLWHRLAELIIRKPYLMFIRRSLDRRGVRYRP